MIINSKLKASIIYIIFLFIAGCSNSGVSSNNSNNNQNNLSCPDKPIHKLASKNVKEISLQEQKITESGQVSVDKNIGFTFRGKQKQKLNYATNNDICIWIYTPDNDILNSTELPSDGTYIIQVAALRGAKTFDLDLSFAAQPQPVPPEPIEPPPEELIDPDKSQLTQEQAVEIVANWYEAKPKIFGNPFDVGLVKKYTTEKLEENTLKKDGSMNWLRNNGCYYTYNISNIEDVISFSNTVQRPTLTIKIYEELQLHGPKKVGCGKKPRSYRASVTYWFEKDNGEWKIYHYKVNK